MNLHILLVVVVLLSATGFSQGDPLEKVTVEIKNDINPNTGLTVQCKSKEDDLGPHILEKGQAFSFKFKVNFFQTTLFFCNFRWKSPEGKIESKWFNIYSARDDRMTCSMCRWLVHEQDMCRYIPAIQNYRCFPYK